MGRRAQENSVTGPWCAGLAREPNRARPDLTVAERAGLAPRRAELREERPV